MFTLGLEVGMDGKPELLMIGGSKLLSQLTTNLGTHYVNTDIIFIVEMFYYNLNSIILYR